MLIDPMIPLVARCAFIALFMSALIHKLRSPQQFAEAVRGYIGLFGSVTSVKQPLIALVALSVIATEAALLVLLLVPVPVEWQAAGCAAVLLGYAMLMGWSVLRKHSIDCGCSFGSTRQIVGWGTVLRNLALAAGAVLMLLPSSARPLGVADFISIAALLIIAALIYQVVNQLLANASNLQRSS